MSLAPLTPVGLRKAGTLTRLRDQYREDLFADFLAFMDNHVIDHELGGFMCDVDLHGQHLSTDKNTWFEGRGIWVYAFLYRTLDPNPRHLEVARRSIDFVLRARPAGAAFWPWVLNREGEPKAAGEIYCGLFIAEGLAEYARAANDDRYRQLAKDIVLSHLAAYDDQGYAYDCYYGPAATPPVRGPRVLGHWMVLLRVATQMLEAAPDPQLQQVADRSLVAIMDRHYNPAFGLLNEVLNHDLSRPTNGLEQFVYTGHGIETLWMVMDEARRRHDGPLFDLAAKRFKRHVEVSWDDVYQGVCRCLTHVDDNLWTLDKVLWLQEEVLIGALSLFERTGDPWAAEWYCRMFNYVQIGRASCRERV